MSETRLEVSVDTLVGLAKRNVERYSQFLKHTPTMLRQSMMLAYQTATDDMLKACDASRTKEPVIHDPDKPVVLLDDQGHAS